MNKINKMRYEKPIIKVIELKKEDIIKTSGALSVTDSLFGKGNGGVNVG